MATCKDCLYVKICQKTRIMNPTHNYAIECDDFKDRSRFVELPCKVGDKVFYFDMDGRIYVQTVKSLTYGLTKTGFVIHSDVDFVSDLFGDRFFLSYEEAEAALRDKNENRSD